VRVVAVFRFKHAEWGAKAMYFESRQHLADAAHLFRTLLNRDGGGELVGVAAHA
jgi:hypothetical protein